MSTPTTPPISAEHRISWAEKAKRLPPTVPLTRQASLSIIPPPIILPPPNDKLTWVERGRLLPSAIPVGSHHIMPQLGDPGWVQAGLSLPSLAPVHNTQVHLKKLLLNAHQRQLIDILYAESKNIEFLYDTNASKPQVSAEAKLLALGLNPVSRNALESRWTAQYSVKWGSGMQEQRRTLFQCSCGYHVQARQEREADKGVTRKAEDWQRRVPYPFTGCLAHIELTERVRDGAISRIAGFPEHNDPCQTAVLERVPPIPLHEHVYEVALGQLRSGARYEVLNLFPATFKYDLYSLTAIQEKNSQMVYNRAYHGMEAYDSRTANVRYVFLPTDHTSLYRKASQDLGVDVRLQPQYNVDEWLNPESPNFKAEVAKAVFHYSARAEAEDRFEICLSTPEMDKCAHKYAHHSQLVLDGTFGVCSSRLLLFIALAVDENNKGMPVALFLFSAETGAKATHASYNTTILEKLIRSWKLHLETEFGSFEPYSAITDTNTKERGALIRIWPQIVLLICKFHLRQCWTNHRKKILKCRAPDFWKNHTRDLLQKLEVDLIATVDHAVATALLDDHKAFFNNLATNPEAKRACEAGLDHIKYLQNYWMTRPLWESWSECGRITAAARIGVAVEGIIPTTNHLESFNAVLKRKYVQRYLRSGHRLRFDILILLLITQILPQIFQRRNAQREYQAWLTSRFYSSSGGQDLLLAQRKHHDDQKEYARQLRSVCWWPMDEGRHQHACELVHKQSLHSIITQSDPDGLAYIAHCNPSSGGPTPYVISICTSGCASCTCLDFHHNGKACKHLCALRILIDSWVTQGLIHTHFHYPLTLEHAQALCRKDREASPPLPMGGTSETSIASESFSMTSWAVVQAIGGDATLLGTAFDGELDLDLSSDGGSSDGGSSDSRLSDEGLMGDFDQPSLFQEGISAQIMHRLSQEAHALLPRLYGIENVLSDVQTPPSSPELLEFQQVIGKLSAQLSRLQMGGSHFPEATAHLQTTQNATDTLAAVDHPPLGHKRKRDRGRALRAPSPEAKQRRKTSNGTL
ncbi:hypothetical protein EV368DRAFT_79123 [Lentinula lateritia]|nr:hypothetical protein EV368DRAFT_79123 [Lentinula lateritia]